MFHRDGAESSGIVVIPLPADGRHSHPNAHAPRSPLQDAMSSDNSSVHASISQAVSAVHGWGFSASPYSLETLDATKHDHELRPDGDGRVHVHFDSHTMGLGGYDSWSPNVDEVFLVQPQLPPPSLRQSTMPSYIAPRSVRSPPKALNAALRLVPWPHS